MSARNPGSELDLEWVESVRVNKPACFKRAEELKVRRGVKKNYQIAWLLKAMTCIDLTTLSGDDTETNVQRLCFKAKQPIRRDLLEAVDMQKKGLTVGAVCVYPARVADAVKILKGLGASHIPVASAYDSIRKQWADKVSGVHAQQQYTVPLIPAAVAESSTSSGTAAGSAGKMIIQNMGWALKVATGFPAGQTHIKTRLAEIRIAVEDGAREIDIVINRAYALAGNWKGVYAEVKAFREACGPAHMKTILATGELGSLTNVYKASLVAMMAGSDFIKTSTGKEGVNAILPVGLVMVRAIREYYKKTGVKVGFKPAGGIRTAKDSCTWLALMKEELGNDWLNPDLFRLGASSLLGDIERQLFHGVTGRYAAAHEFAMT